jgi:Uri superfamily endonuclease
VRLPNKPSVSLVPGRYIYAGSAYGPGGLKARVSRHMRRAKRSQWHIDQLTKTGKVGSLQTYGFATSCANSAQQSDALREHRRT